MRRCEGPTCSPRCVHAATLYDTHCVLASWRPHDMHVYCPFNPPSTSVITFAP